MSALEESKNLAKSRKISPSFTSSGNLSEASGSNSAPTELFAEFLFCVMKKDYEKALNYCAQILHCEPNNSTARKFYSLLVEKLEMKLESSSSESSESVSSDSSDSSDSSESASSHDETC